MSFYFPLPAFALDEATSPLKGLPTFGELIFKTSVAIVIVVGLIVLLAWYLKSYIVRGGGSDLIRVIDKVYIDTRRFLCLVKVGDKYFLLGVGDGGVNLIAELEKVSTAGGEEVVVKPSFKKQLERFLGKRE